MSELVCLSDSMEDTMEDVMQLLFQAPPKPNENEEMKVSREQFVEEAISKLKIHLINKFKVKYINIEYLQKGGSGIVFSGAKLTDNCGVAIKVIPFKNIEKWCTRSIILPNTNVKKLIIPSEIDIMDKLKGMPGVIKIIESYQDNDIDSFIIVMERPESSQDLYEYITENTFLSETISRNIMKQILTILESMRNKGIHYRDLKDENLLINSKTMQVVIIDVGCAIEFKNGEMRLEIESANEPYGTVEWSAPECFRKGIYDGMKVSVWALGTLLYVMLTGSLPFNNEKEIQHSKLMFPTMPFLTDECKQLITKCLTKDPDARLTMEDVSQHPWIMNQETFATAQ